jgi:putative endonuclease
MADFVSVTKQDIRPKWQSSSETGERGERIALEYLIETGYMPVVSNFKAAIGRNTVGTQVTGEIDIIALEDGVLCFIEVKSRRSRGFGGPLAAVDVQKQRQITRTARVYRRIFHLFDHPHRFDVVTVIFEKGRAPEVELVRGFWTEAKFKKKQWNGDIWGGF